MRPQSAHPRDRIRLGSVTPEIHPIIERLTVLCAGNICRSPMAWGLFRADPDLARLGIAVASAGLMAEVGSPPAALAVRVLAERGIDIRAHRAQQVTEAGLREADCILVMESWQRKWIGQRWPALTGRVFLLGHWGNFEIADPYDREIAVFRATCAEIERGVREWVPHLVHAHANRPGTEIPADAGKTPPEPQG
ncbi:MAG: low molecular weight protein-tyrosine-phosphatase [Gammaproteobacteria bacterium]